MSRRPTMNQISIDLQGKTDREGRRYYSTTDPMPGTIDLNTAVLLIFPWEEEGEFGAELILKHRTLDSRREKP
jgi:hypothetical protein